MPLKFMDDQEYQNALRENPELYWHPDFMTTPDCPSRDFKFTEPLMSTDDFQGEKSASSQQSFYSVNTHSVAGNRNSIQGRGGFMNSMRTGSVYLDVYTGEEDID